MLLAEKIKLIVALKRKGKERMVEEQRKVKRGRGKEERKLMCGFQERIDKKRCLYSYM